MLFSHGFGCDQQMWRFVAPAFEDDHDVILHDHVGAGWSDINSWSPERYGTLKGYADDLIELVDALGTRGGVFVGHSVAGMIGVLASNASPGLFSQLILVTPSPRYVNDPEDGYIGGFDANDIEDMLGVMSDNYLGWSHHMATVIMANPETPELATELDNSFCRTDPKIAEHFARVTFTSDNRADLAQVQVPCLILACADDAIAPRGVGQYLAAELVDAELVELDATGHCPHLSAPDDVIREITSYLVRSRADR